LSLNTWAKKPGKKRQTANLQRTKQKYMRPTEDQNLPVTNARYMGNAMAQTIAKSCEILMAMSSGEVMAPGIN
jgi:hypothetical protein